MINNMIHLKEDGMEKVTKGTRSDVFLLLAVLFAFSLVFLRPALAFESGKTYDADNWQEIADLVPPPVLNWVKKGEFVLMTGKLGFDFKHNDSFTAAGKANQGKYGIDPAGNLIDKKTNEMATGVYGMPFPTIDPKLPEAGDMIIANCNYQRYRTNGNMTASNLDWIGTQGMERQIVDGTKMMFFEGRSGSLPNPENFLELNLICVSSPMDLRGISQMTYRYKGEKQDTVFSYVPMIRRVVRLSGAAKSDPFLGSDFCTDDQFLWNGKNTSFTWKFIGEKTILCPFGRPDAVKLTERPDGTIAYSASPPMLKYGLEVPGWKGAPWAIQNAYFSPRPVWIVEGNPKDTYYNYGKQLFYVDRDTFISWFKEVYDRAGAYWKTIIAYQTHAYTDSGKNNIGFYEIYQAVDDKAHHATNSRWLENPPGLVDSNYVSENVLSRGEFTTNNMMQWSK
jgi:hypothetical protein